MPRDRPPWRIYKKEMSIHMYGDALWEPTPTPNYTCINVGDVGFIRDGQFHLLFSAASPLGQRRLGIDVPLTFQQLDVGDPVSDEREPGCLHTPTVRQIGPYAGARGFTSLPEGTFTFELTGDRGAALVTRHPTHRKDSPSRLEPVFEEYTKRHYKSWVELARRGEDSQDVQPVLVSGFDVTKDFAMVSYLSHSGGASLQSGCSIPKPMFDPENPPFRGAWRFIQTPYFQNAEGASAEFDQCVFIRYFTMRFKPLLKIPKVIRAGAGPHDLGSGDNQGETFPELTVQSNDESTVTGGEDAGGQPGRIMGGAGSEQEVVVRNALCDDGFNDWDIIAEYVFKNSKAASALLHHRDLTGAGSVGDTDGLRALLARYRPHVVVNANGVGRIAHPALQELYHLDASALSFHDQLDNILHSQRYELCVPNLGDSDLMGLVDYLDEALDSLDPSSRAARKCARELRSVCGSNAILPASSTVSPDLLSIDPDPFAPESFGDMYRGIHNGSVVCVKRLRVLNQNDLPMVTKTLCEEAVIWKRLNHPNILPLLGITILPPQLVSDWMAGGDLQRYAKKNTDIDVLVLFSDVAKGLCYLHACDVVHGNLKGVNVLVDIVDNSPHARIACFSALAVTKDLVSRRPPMRQTTHSTRWSAPEVLRGGNPSKESDLYAFAMIMLEIFTNQVPFSDRSDHLATSAIIAGEHPSRPTHPTCTDNLWSLMQRCWDQNPHLRPDASKALQILLALDTLDKEQTITRSQPTTLVSDTPRSPPVTRPPRSLPRLGVSNRALPGHPVLQKLSTLDKTLSEFQGRLSDVLYGEEYAQCATELRDDDLAWLVNYLDEALEYLSPFSATSRKCLRELRSICASNTMLPSSYMLSSLLTVSPEPFDSGGNGDVYRGTLDRSDICIKRVRAYARDGPEKAAKMFCREAVVWKHLRHPNIVPLLGVTITPPQLISDWMPGGDLLENSKRPGANRRSLLSDVAEGLCYLHSCNVIHGDLKGCNILVDSFGRARITDFTLAMVMQDSARSVTSPGHGGFTPRWSAPEVLTDATYSKESDIFSFAMVMVEVFSDAVPFGEKPATLAMFEIMSGKRPPRPTHPALTSELWTLMQSCWDQEPRLRPAVSEVLSVLRGIDCPTWKSLISDALPMHERISLITMIFSDPNQVRIAGDLSGDDAQAFVDKIDELLDCLTPQIHRKCLRYLYEICGRKALVPRSLEAPLCFDPEENPVFHGLADVWQGRHRGQKVAAQAFRISPGDDTGNIKKRFCMEVITWRTLRHPNLLPLLAVTTTENRLVTVSKWMSNGNIVEFTQANANADRLGLLRGVTRGLIYMHDQRIIHGDLNGANIFIDDDGSARIGGFGMVTIVSDRSPIAPLTGVGGTIPWMSPELLYPEKFGLKSSHPTLGSDRYALGMVIYEVLSGQAPFANYRDPEVVVLVLEGTRPQRPAGDEGKIFASGVWETLELCWNEQSEMRPNARNILMGLEGKLCLSDLDGDAETVTEELGTMEGGFGLPIERGNGGPTGPSSTGRRARRMVEGFKKILKL